MRQPSVESDYYLELARSACEGRHGELGGVPANYVVKVEHNTMLQAANGYDENTSLESGARCEQNYARCDSACRSPQHVTRIKLHLAIYFCLHREQFAGKHCKMASSLSNHES